MDREQLIQQVKGEYARLADLESREHITGKPSNSISPEAFYERALEKAITAISAGKYDDCISGAQVVERIANHKTKAGRIEDTIAATRHHMEAAEEIIAAEPQSKTARELKAKNERRGEAIPQLIRDLKQEQALEELEAVNSAEQNI